MSRALKKKLKILFAFLTSLNAAYASSSIWSGKADTSWHTGAAMEFTITTPEQLAGLARLVNGGNDFKGKTVKLGAGIMLNDTANWRDWASAPPANEWVAIGKYSDSSSFDSRSFNGIFDGSGFAVSGVYINSARSGQGLFGNLDSSGAIKNLGVIASYVKGKNYVGGLAGYSRSGTISGSYSTAWVFGQRNVGGLAGRNGGKGIIINSYSAGKASGRSEVGGLVGYSDYKGTISGSYSAGEASGQLFVGGLAGSNNGTISSSYSAGAAIGDSSASATGGFGVGGLAGSNGGTVTNSYSAGVATGEIWVGGLAGTNPGIIINSHSTSKVTGNEEVGGLAGINDGTVSNSYSVGSVAGKAKVGGIAGSNDGTASNSYYNREAGNQGKGQANGKTAAEMRSKDFADSLNFMAGLLSMNAWVHSPGKYPVLSGRIAAKTGMGSFFAGGDGTEASPYMIGTKKQLENLSFLVNSGLSFFGKYLKLSQNIAVNDTANWLAWAIKPLAVKWTPIGTRNSPFQGTFDGGGFAVSGVYINSSSEISAGLFGNLGFGGTVKNLGATALYIKGVAHAGGLVGYNEGAVINSYSAGKIIATSAGGLVGCNCGDSSAVTNSYSTASVSGQESVGGLVGINYGIISGSYSTGDARGRKVGGLVGFNSGEGTISSSYSTGDARGKKLVGSNYGTVADSYYGSESKQLKK